jgi:hypothetical protein
MPRDIAEGVLHAGLAVTAASTTQSQLELLAGVTVACTLTWGPPMMTDCGLISC